MSDAMKTAVAVVGGGPGGYAAAFMAADLGLDTTLIDVRENPGGVCLYEGCIPSKALLHVAKLIINAREGAHFGVHFSEPRVDLDRVRAATQEIVRSLTGGLGQLGKARKVQYIQGRATFQDAKTLAIVHSDGHQELLEADFTILAAGSRPTRLGPLIESEHIMDSTDALELRDIPKTLLVVGGGYIGLELGTVYAALGSQVTLVELTEGLLPGVDRDLVKPLAARLATQLHRIHLGTRVGEMKDQKNGIKVSLEMPDKSKENHIYDKVLVCVGRKPNSSGLGLRSTKVEVDDHAFVKVDQQMRTAETNVFAIGDLVGGMMLAHKASHEGRVAAEVIAGHNVAFEARAIPAVVFTDPEIAWAGLTEEQAQKQERKIKVTKFPWAASGRAKTLNRTEGMTKIITDPESDQVLGLAIVGEGAGELISEGVLAIEMGATAKDLDLTIHPHPTLSETVMESAAALFGQSTHMYKKAK